MSIFQKKLHFFGSNAQKTSKMPNSKKHHLVLANFHIIFIPCKICTLVRKKFKYSIRIISTYEDGRNYANNKVTYLILKIIGPPIFLKKLELVFKI